MFVADFQTYDSLKKLWGLRKDGPKTLLIWVGAGASAWLGYERWADLATRFHRSFLRIESRYRRAEATQDLENQNYPAVFQECWAASSQSYFSQLADAFRPRTVTPVYKRFLDAVRQLETASIV